MNKCLNCKKPTKNLKFCSKKCSNVYWGKIHVGENNPNYNNQKLKGENNPNWKGGKTVLVNYICSYCRKEFLCRSAYPKKFCSKECRLKGWLQSDKRKAELSKRFLGEKNYFWKGGLAKKYEEWRKKVYKRDNFTCGVCKYDKGGTLNAHHILPKKTYPEYKYELWNGITVCKDCHIMLHKHNYSDAINNFLKVRGLENIKKIAPLLNSVEPQNDKVVLFDDADKVYHPLELVIM